MISGGSNNKSKYCYIYLFAVIDNLYVTHLNGEETWTKVKTNPALRSFNLSLNVNTKIYQ